MSITLTNQDAREIASALAGSLAVVGDTANLSLALRIIDKAIESDEGEPMYGEAGIENSRRIYEEAQQFEKPVTSFDEDLAATINRWSIENGSNTPDYILATFLIDVLGATGRLMDAREQFHGRPGINPLDVPMTSFDDRMAHAIANGETYPPLEPVHASETTEDLLADLRELLRGYEQHHRDKAHANVHADDRLEKAERNARYAKRVERKLAQLHEKGEPTEPYHDALLRIYGPTPRETWERVASGEILPPWVLPEIAEEIGQELPLTLLSEAVKGATLVKSALPDRIVISASFDILGSYEVSAPEALGAIPGMLLYRLLEAAKIAAERADG